MDTRPSLLARTVLDAKRLLLPWLGTACAFLLLDAFAPQFGTGFLGLVPYLAKLYLLAGFSYLAWTELSGRREEPASTRYFSRSGKLFVNVFIIGLVVSVISTGLRYTAWYLEIFWLNFALSLALAAAFSLLAHTMAAAGVERDFTSGILATVQLIKESRGWAWLLVLVDPGLSTATTLLVLTSPSEALFWPGVFISGLAVHLLILFVTLGLIRLRVDLDAAAAQEANEIKLEEAKPRDAP